MGTSRRQKTSSIFKGVSFMTKQEKIIIYHPSSFGGTYEHALFMFAEFEKQHGKGIAEIYFPVNAKAEGLYFHKVLLTDLPQGSRVLRQIHFLWRTFINPLLFFFKTRKYKGAYILFNDFDQFSGWFWRWFFQAFRSGQTYGIILHDPDRDAYAGNAKRSGWLMRQVMLPMDVAFYHEVLPKLPYYDYLPKTSFHNVMLGLMPACEPDQELLKSLQTEVAGFKVMSILGNIREEKNYHIAITALKEYPNAKLIIGGRKANSGVDVDAYRKLADSLGVTNQVIWLERFLTDAELSAIITISDYSILNYSSTFKSQSGVITLVASYRKPIIASDGESALAAVVKRFGLGLLAEPDNQESYNHALGNMMAGNYPNGEWDQFEAFASWETNIKTTMNAFKMASQKNARA
jgi:glycosyltransferase involved in cell wall biosynthesis